ncbi:MAG: hypothetical protein UW30_C0015G0001 [Candidatus Giovannonibacteria bacterium GW2011_GWA2_44_13b]|uniref:LiaF transmembrane domain-containing protein n=1 Tax=Candidatus Giovannonibacteria bacterium GW2011_GWA2_44_13b TaxID=1618647 RepID=A0A0G1H240_9BACT|nr:MAG: hypothetical protein UW30_C0015G0001 [Candidatus Giovannonibacteria bacterium GW2011_GWA2_44_13b]
MVFAGILIIIGAVFLLKNLGIVSAEAWGLIWPSALIVMGAYMLWKKHQWNMWKDRVWRKLE